MNTIRYLWNMALWVFLMAVLGFVVGVLAGCGGGSPSDPDSPENNTLPVGCVSTGCAK